MALAKYGNGQVHMRQDNDAVSNLETCSVVEGGGARRKVALDPQVLDAVVAYYNTWLVITD